MLADNRVVFLKFFLHISKEEQAERLRERLDNPTKHWKFSVADLKMRERWKDFQDAYPDAINHCSTKHAPWHIVPANHKWFRNLAVAEAIVKALEPYEDEWRQTLLERGERNFKVLQEAR